MHETFPVASPRALILAAGVGRRLAATDQRSKCLLAFGGKTLLRRHLDLLRGQGVTDISVVTGYQADSVRTAAGNDATCLVNPDFREGSVVSLWAGRTVLRAGTPVLLMDADVIYDARLLARLLAGHAPNRLLLDRDIEPGDEPVKLCIAAGRIVDFHKRPQFSHEWHGESVGFFYLAPDAAAELADRAEAYVTGGRRQMEYEEPMRDMILASAPDRFGYEDVTGLPWTEIDFPEDVAKAEALLPALAG